MQTITLSRPTRWGISPNLRHLALFLALILLFGASQTYAAYTEPRFALTRVSSFASSTGRLTLKVEGSFSFADALQLGMPLSVVVTQGTVSGRFDLLGNAFVSLSGGPEQAAPPPGVVAVAQREITVVLPSNFTAGAAQIRVLASYDGKQLASNQLSVTL